jgi:predicted rRNA methylase YqxC with S4 and FtsJ domains
LEIKAIDLILGMQFTSSYGIAKDAFLEKRVKINGKIIENHKQLVEVEADSIINCKEYSMRADEALPYFIKQKYIPKSN